MVKSNLKILALTILLLTFSITQGRAELKYNYSDITYYKVSLASGDKYGYLLVTTGQWIIPPQFDDAKFFSKDNLARIAIDSKYGFIDITGNIIIKPQFESVRNFSEDLAVVKINGKYGFIDKTGKLVIEPKLDNAHDFLNGTAEVEFNNKRVLVDRKGKIVKNLEPSPIILFRDKENHIVQQGIVFQRELGQSDESEDSFTWLRMEANGKWGCINKDRQWLVLPRFDIIDNYWIQQQIIKSHGYYYDTVGNKLSHYVNYMQDGYKYLSNNDLETAVTTFQAALVINPGDEAALRGIAQAKEQLK